MKTYIEVGLLDTGEWGMSLHTETLCNEQDVTDPLAVVAIAGVLRKLSAAFDKMERMVLGEAA